MMTSQQANPADVYDSRFVPALFAQWGPVVVRAANVQPGDRVLDVACGTGALTLAAAERTGRTGSVVGLDASPDMLEVARRKSSSIDWMEGVAESLPLSDASFDAVVSQFGFMFFTDKTHALQEMMRVLRPGGRLAVLVCDAVENSPGYGALARTLDTLFGKKVEDSFRAPFSLGNVEEFGVIFRDAGILDVNIAQHHGNVNFASVDALVSTERACVWTLGGLLDDAQFERLLQECRSTLKPFEVQDGGVQFDMPCLIATARKA